MFLVTVRHADVLGVPEVVEVEPLGAAIGAEERVEEQRPVSGLDRERRPAEIANPGQPQATE
jgi:hypothetical protein